MQGQTYQFLGPEGGFQIQQPLLLHQIHGRPAFSFGQITVQQGKSVIADGDAMLWMDGSLNMETECYGGCGASCCRSCAGESFCMNKYSGAGDATFGFDTPGDLLSFGVTPEYPWMIKSSAFVAGTDNIIVSAQFSGCLPCLCTDQGLFLTTVSIDPEKGGQGVFLAGSYGMLERHDVPEGKTLIVGGGNFFASRTDTPLEVGLVGGVANLCCGAGWKAIVFKFTGPCTIYTQSRNPMDLKRLQTRSQEEQQKNNQQGDSGGDAGGDAGGE